MTQFRFRMAPLLRIREAARDECRLQLAESERADAELAAQLAELGRKQDQLQSERREAAGEEEELEDGPLDAGESLNARELEKEAPQVALELDGAMPGLEGEGGAPHQPEVGLKERRFEMTK